MVKLLLELLRARAVAEEPQHSAPDFFIVEHGGEFEVLGPQAGALGYEERVGDVGKHLLHARLADERERLGRWRSGQRVVRGPCLLYTSPSPRD